MSNRVSITTKLKTDLGNVSVANGYTNDFSNIYRWKSYPLSSSTSFSLNIKDGVNNHSLEEGYKEILAIELTAMFKLPKSTVTAEEEAYYLKAASVIEDIIKCLYDNESAYKTLLGEGGFMFQIQSDEIIIDEDAEGGLNGEVIVNVNAVHKILETWEIDD